MTVEPMAQGRTTVKDVQKWVGYLRQVAERNPRGAIYTERIIWEAVIGAIANGTAENPRAVAMAALQTQGVRFDRGA